VPGGIEQNAHVVLRLVVSERGTEGDRAGDARHEIVHADVEMRLR